MALAAKGCVVYGKAFNCFRVTGEPLDLSNLAQVQLRIDEVTLFEVKSTRKEVGQDFGGYSFLYRLRSCWLPRVSVSVFNIDSCSSTRQLEPCWI
jgi:hypothetical protein